MKEPFAYSNDSRVEIMLLKLLNNIGAPHYAFKDLMEWAHDAYISGYKFTPKRSSYQQQINKIEKWLNLSQCRPFQKQVNLPPDELELQVTCFPFIPMLESLFNDPEINHECNLVINTDDPFSKYKSKNGSLGEVNSGNWYQQAYKNMVTNPVDDFLCPIIFSMDKTTISNMSSLHVYAVMFTTTIFDLKVIFCCYVGFNCI